MARIALALGIVVIAAGVVAAVWLASSGESSDVRSAGRHADRAPHQARDRGGGRQRVIPGTYVTSQGRGHFTGSYTPGRAMTPFVGSAVVGRGLGEPERRRDEPWGGDGHGLLQQQSSLVRQAPERPAQRGRRQRRDDHDPARSGHLSAGRRHTGATRSRTSSNTRACSSDTTATAWAASATLSSSGSNRSSRIGFKPARVSSWRTTTTLFRHDRALVVDARVRVQVRRL